MLSIFSDNSSAISIFSTVISMSIVGFPASPGTAVLPICSIEIALSEKIGRKNFTSVSNAFLHSGLYGSTLYFRFLYSVFVIIISKVHHLQLLMLERFFQWLKVSDFLFQLQYYSFGHDQSRERDKCLLATFSSALVYALCFSLAFLNGF